MTWSKEQIDRLSAMWMDGHSAGEISRALQTKTRNAVIGKVVRMKLNVAYPHCESHNQFKPAAKKRVRRVPMAQRKPRPTRIEVIAALPKPIIDPNDKPRKTFAELEADDCRFIPGDPLDGGKIFCGKRQFPGFSYCLAHLKVCATVTKVREPTAPAQAQEKAEAV